ncbi:MAG: HPr family phosphocarrier protein [Oscillospiraceae bacterium]|nr:HPr family phosphocarrier protein [Oscillospiraceae bacterium]
MIEIEYKIKNENGIHARPAGVLVDSVKNFESDIKLGRMNDFDYVNAKKLLAVMGLNLKKGEKIKITIDGSDEKEANFVVEKILKERF